MKMRVSLSFTFLWTIAQRFGHTRAALQFPLNKGSINLGENVVVDRPLGTEDPWLHRIDPSILQPVPLAVNGNSTNKVDLVYFGDGYRKDEQATFLRDAQFLTDTLLQPGGAFSPVRDLLNFWAVLLPSQESGIGTHGKPRNTTFGLYRPGEELRAVFYAHPERVAAACNALNDVNFAGGCDEPILLGNDPFYGGLGGTPTVITASRNNGVQVLRHELGHTLIPVGEEYDGGYAYFGVNAAAHTNTTKQDVTWRQWLSDPKARRTGRVRLEDSRVAVQQYPWFDLSNRSYTVRFEDHGEAYPTALLRFSVSGIPTEHRLMVKLDGEEVKYEFSKDHRGSLDRTWVQIELEHGLRGVQSKTSRHCLEFTASAASEKVRPMLSSVEVIEYGPEERFNKMPGHIGAYPTVDIDGGVTLRPTNEGCLMRDVTVPTDTSSDNSATIAITLLNMTDATYALRWYRGTTEINTFANQTTIRVPGRAESTVAAWYTAEVELSLPQVRLEGREEMKENVKIWYQGCD
ncbi:hypothetical protein QFC20_003955 [Naganishia adeliensis]|uniref:Uncharacterized protein n=1 Tax=Naganishia adeliensis TaxID=92952 RepID=A0ACC2W7W4_9TREE|nr:hypothetical protein QFC20_003955 [Naganishia adeliensis]